MKKLYIALLLMACNSKGMEQGERNPLLFQNPQGHIMSIPDDLLPFTERVLFNQQREPLKTYLPVGYFQILKNLLYIDATRKCLGHATSKCSKDIVRFLKGQMLQGDINFIAWFELLYLTDFLHCSSAVQDAVALHLAHLIKDKETIAVETINEMSDDRVFIYANLWDKVAALYELIFDTSLVEENKNMIAHGYSIHQLLLCDKVHSVLLQVGDHTIEEINLSGMNIVSLDGWDEIENLSAIQFLNLSDNLITYIPDHFLDSCPGLIVLSIEQNKLNALPIGFLSQCTELREIHLNGNNIQSLPDDFLQHRNKLYALNLSSNQLQLLPENFLDNCAQLNLLNLGANQLRTLPNGFLNQCPNLQKLILYNNQLQLLPEGFLGNCPLLQELTFANNKLIELPDNFLHNCGQLNFLSIANNQLAAVSKDFLSQCPLLRYVYLNNNQLDQLPDGFLANCTQLNVLRLSNNRLQLLPTDFLDNCPQLQELACVNNQLIELPNKFLSNCAQLKVLLLAYNHLQKIPQGFLDSCPELKQLTLEDNQLQELPQDFLDNCVKLKNFSIDNNLIDDFSNISAHAQKILKAGTIAIESHKRKASSESDEQSNKKQKK